ncbi:hypothetical protein BD560DRAFT_407189 [Blakeslea trispora]|nr:hypothetical protein BD560DRAFT_407189 [Blakeslea trispora]
MDTEQIEISQRVSRKRRHLPTSITSAVTSRSNHDYRHIPLLKMSYRKEQSKSEDEVEPEANTTARSGKQNAYQRRPKNQAKLKRKAMLLVSKEARNESSKKHVIWLMSAAWILFLVYRIFNSMQKDDYGNLSLVHFVANKMTTSSTSRERRSQ